MASSSRVIARSDSSSSHAAVAVRHQARLVDGRPDDRVQGRQELVSAADRVGAGAYPESQHVDVDPRDLAGLRWALAFHQGEGAIDGLAARRGPGLGGEGGCAPQRLPGGAGRSGDAAWATDRSADSAAARRPDQASAQAAPWRAVSRAPDQQ